MSSRIYFSDIEYLYTQKSKDFKRFKGGSVYAFVKATDSHQALVKILGELEKLGLKSIDIESISPYDSEMEWETENQTMNFINLYEEAKKSENVIFDDFYAYEND